VEAECGGEGGTVPDPPVALTAQAHKVLDVVLQVGRSAARCDVVHVGRRSPAAGKLAAMPVPLEDLEA